MLINFSKSGFCVLHGMQIILQIGILIVTAYYFSLVHVNVRKILGT